MLRIDNSSPLGEEHVVKSVAKAEKWTANMLFVIAIHVIAACSLILYRPRIQTIALCFILWQASALGTTEPRST